MALFIINKFLGTTIKLLLMMFIHLLKITISIQFHDDCHFCRNKLFYSVNEKYISRKFYKTLRDYFLRT